MTTGNRPRVGLWFYTNEFGHKVRARILERLHEAGLEVVYDFDMRACYCLDGRVYTADGTDLSALDVFYHMNAEERNAHQDDILRQIEESGVTVFNPYQAYAAANDKFRASCIMRRAGVDVPPSMLIPTDVHEATMRRIFREWGSVVVKPRDKTCAKGIMKFDDFEPFNDFVLFAQDHVGGLYLERYIPFAERDIRVEVFADEVVGEGFTRIMGHSFKTNVRSGGRAVFIPAEDDAKDLAVRAARALGMTTTIVDMVRSLETGRPVVLEVNPLLGVFYGAHFESIGQPAPEYFERMDALKVRLIADHIIKLVSK